MGSDNKNGGNNPAELPGRYSFLSDFVENNRLYCEERLAFFKELEKKGALTLAKALIKVSEILENSRGDFIGAYRECKQELAPEIVSEALFLEKNTWEPAVSRDVIVNRLAGVGVKKREVPYSPVFDTSVLPLIRDWGLGYKSGAIMLGNQRLACFDTRLDQHYWIFGEQVTQNLYEIFELQVEEAVSVFLASLNGEKAEIMNSKKLSTETELALKVAKLAKSEVSGFKQNFLADEIEAFDLKAFRKGERVRKEIEKKEMVDENGNFCIYGVCLESNTVVLAGGRESEDGVRLWSEGYFRE